MSDQGVKLGSFVFMDVRQLGEEAHIPFLGGRLA